MPPTLSRSGLVSVVWTNIVTADVDRDVISGMEDGLILVMGVHIDRSLFGKRYEFKANFRIVEVATGQSFNHYWNDQLDGFQPFAPDMWLSMWWTKAQFAGVTKTTSLYLFRPYLEVVAVTIEVDFSTGEEFKTVTGDSEFGVAEEHYFLLEAGT